VSGPLIRPEGPQDIPGIDTAVAAAFGQRDEADLVLALRADPAWLPSLSLVAVVDGRVIGHIVFTRCQVGGHPALALAPLGVTPEHQREGVGGELVISGLLSARGAGERLVIVLGDPEYYGRFGFEAARQRDVTGPFGDIEEFQALRLRRPAPTGPVVYAPPFGA